MTKILLEDAIPFTFQLDESESLGNRKRLRGLFHLGDVKNANKRIYPSSLLEREVKRIMPAVKERRILGELGHPNTPLIRLDKASHVITDLKISGNKILGELEVIGTPSGKTLLALLESGVKIGISSRGFGSVSMNEEGVNVVQEDYNLVTWDIVPNPSTPEAWLNESEVVTKKEVRLVEPTIIVDF